MNDVFQSLDEDLYNLLGLKQQESDQFLIKKRFSEMIKIFHSDRAGEGIMHMKIVEAFRIISNKALKYIYDNYGLSAVYLFEEDEKIILLFKECQESISMSDSDRKKIEEYFKKQIEERFIEKGEVFFPGYSEVSKNFETFYLDYIYHTKYLGSSNIIKPKKSFFFGKKIDMNSRFQMFQSNSSEINIDFGSNMNPETSHNDISFGVELNQKISLPYDLKIFDQNFFNYNMKISKHIKSDETETTLHNSLKIYNIFDKPVNMSVTPVFNLNGKNLESCEYSLDIGFNQNINSQLIIDPLHKSLDLTCQLLMNKRRFISFINTGPNRFSLGGVLTDRTDRHHSKSYTVMLRQNSLFFTNESVIKWKSFAIKFISNLSLSKGGTGESINCNSSIALGLQIKSFKIQIPVSLSKYYNYFSHSLIFLSSILGRVFAFARKRLKSRRSWSAEIMDRISLSKHENYVHVNLELFNKKLSSIVPGKLYIIQAYLGEFKKIREIYQNLSIFGTFRNEDEKVFDVKIALTLNTFDDDLNIPKDFTEIDGIYVPNYLERHNLAIVVYYNYEYTNHLALFRNYS